MLNSLLRSVHRVLLYLAHFSLLHSFSSLFLSPSLLVFCMSFNFVLVEKFFSFSRSSGLIWILSCHAIFFSIFFSFAVVLIRLLGIPLFLSQIRFVFVFRASLHFHKLDLNISFVRCACIHNTYKDFYFLCSLARLTHSFFVCLAITPCRHIWVLLTIRLHFHPIYSMTFQFSVFIGTWWCIERYRRNHHQYNRCPLCAVAFQRNF